MTTTWKWITCTTCKGSGQSPFQVTTPERECSECGGDGEVRVSFTRI